MSGIWEEFREFRGSHSAHIIASVLLILAGLYTIASSPDTLGLAVGVIFLIAGVLNVLK